jgi:hypothetical protein
MHRVTVTFERVFDLVRSGGYDGKPAHSLFGFSAATGTYYGVEVPGQPEIQPGHTVIALLEEQGNWQTLAGWLNQTTGEVAAPSFGGGALASSLMLGAGLACLYLIWPSAYAFLSLPFFAGAGYWAWYTRRAARIRATLRNHRHELGAAT